MILGGRRLCTLSIHWPGRWARAARFSGWLNYFVSNRPIWLAEAADRELPPLVPVRGVAQPVFAGEGARRFLKRPLLVGQLEIHDRDIAQAEPAGNGGVGSGQVCGAGSAAAVAAEIPGEPDHLVQRIGTVEQRLDLRQ